MAFPNKAARYDYLNKLKIQEEDSDQIPKAEKGIPNGVATLDNNGKVPLAQLPPSSGGGGSVDSVNGKVGEVVLTASDVGADSSGTASSVLTSHVADADPHTQYLKNSEVGEPEGVAPLNSNGKIGNEYLPDIAADQITETASREFVTPQDKIDWNGKQEALVSGTNIKTINGTSVLGNGDLVITAVAPVSSVNGKTGEVVIGVDDITDLDLSTKANLTENTFTGVQTFSAGIVEKHSVATAGVVDLSLGNYFTTTITTDTTISVTNEPATGVKSFVLEVVNGGSAVVGYMDGVVWPDGEAPVLTVSGLDILVFYKIDSGGWRGFSAKDLK